MGRKALLLAAAAAFLAGGPAFSGAAPDTVAAHVAAARAAARNDMTTPLGQCDSALPPAAKPAAAPAPAVALPNELPPMQVFDNLYFVGQRDVSAWVVKTSAGLILLDTLNNPKEAEATIAGGLRKLGLDPTQIKDVVITHSHGDHYGGVKYIVDSYHPRVIMSDADWKELEKPALQFNNPNWGPPPKRDVTAPDGYKLTLGDTTLTLRLTPGHTPGTISVLIPVKDRGQPHMAALWGGTAFNFTPSVERFQMYADSTSRFTGAVRQAKADVLISNHVFVDSAVPKMEALRARKTGAAHPFVVGTDADVRFLTVLGECALANRAHLLAGK